MRRFYFNPNSLKDAKAVIQGTDAKHIHTVLRLDKGDRIGLFDGLGFEYEATILQAGRQEIVLTIENRFPCNREPALPIMVAQAMLKDKKMDTVLRHVTELGASSWLPFYATRSIPHLDARRAQNRVERWEKIALESVKQCQRGIVPTIDQIQPFERVLQKTNACQLKLLFWENTAEAIPLNRILNEPGPPTGCIVLMLGPEGGFTDDEVNDAKRAGFQTVSLGPRILKADTATIAACAIILHIFGDM